MLLCRHVLAVADLDTRKRNAVFAIRNATIVAELDISRRCAGSVRNLSTRQVPRTVAARVLAKAVRVLAIQLSANVVDRSVIDDLIALTKTRIAADVVNVDI